jgi:pimeloyl-ACP methyl ester carboxylesterase
MEGSRYSVTSPDGVRIGLLTAGSGPGLLLDVATVAAALAGDQGGPVDVVGHSIGATCVLGAAALGAPFRRIVLYEPPGPQTTRDNWPERVSTMVADGGSALPQRRGTAHPAGPR